MSVFAPPYKSGGSPVELPDPSETPAIFRELDATPIRGHYRFDGPTGGRRMCLMSAIHQKLTGDDDPITGKIAAMNLGVDQQWIITATAGWDAATRTIEKKSRTPGYDYGVACRVACEDAGIPVNIPPTSQGEFDSIPFHPTNRGANRP